MLKSLPKILTLFFLIIFIFQLAGLFFLVLAPSASQAADPATFKPQVEIPGTRDEFGAPDIKTGGYAIPGSTASIAKYVRLIYKYAIGIVGILAAVVLMVGGAMWIVAGGSSTMIGEAKSWIGASLTGLLLALMSYLILATVNPALVDLKTTEIKKVNKIETGCCLTNGVAENTDKSTCAGTFSAGATAILNKKSCTSPIGGCCQNDSDCTSGYICNKNILSGDCYGEEGYGACQAAIGLPENSICINNSQCQSPLKCIAPVGTSSYRCVTVGGDCGGGGTCLEDCASNGKSWCSTCSGSCPGGLWCCH